MRWLAAAVAVFAAATAATAADKPMKKLLLVTHSGGFIHDSVGVAEDVLKKEGPANGYDVTCWRFTGDPDAKVKVKVKEKVDGKDVEKEVEKNALEKYSADFRARTGKTVEKEHCGRVNAESLKKFDVVLFFTTGTGAAGKRGDIGPLTADELKDLTAWVKAGGAFAGTHCASDTLYGTGYGELIGAYFKTHPAIQKVKLKVEDPKHPAAVGIEDGMDWTDEYYVFTDTPYSRDKLHIIMSIQADTFKPNPNGGGRDDKDYAVSWCREEGKGKVFYTSLGHRKEVWQDEKFQKHLFGGLAWATNQAKGDATPSGKAK
jgi:type 1 glutamine amidotransferase